IYVISLLTRPEPLPPVVAIPSPAPAPAVQVTSLPVRPPRPTGPVVVPPPGSGGRSQVVRLGPADPASVQVAQTLLNPSSESAWHCVGVQRFNSNGRLLTSPSEGAGVMFQRASATPPVRLNFRAVRSQPCNLQIVLGKLIVHSRWDPANQVMLTRLATTDGASSASLRQPLSEVYDCTYWVEWSGDNYRLSTGGGQVQLAGVSAGVMDSLTLLALAAGDSEVQTEIRDINTE
ncbi:MAG: hypothetical protein AB1758_25650, partial [Candidatus Eremiobacterota bacterium]